MKACTVIGDRRDTVIFGWERNAKRHEWSDVSVDFDEMHCRIDVARRRP